MAAKIYSAPESIKPPSFSLDIEEYQEKCEQYKKDLRKFVLDRKTGKNVGEIVQFPVADGYAEYMIASMRPLELIHLETNDAWEFQYIHLLTAKEINEKISFEKSLRKHLSKI
jgi:hypothetical protein